MNYEFDNLAGAVSSIGAKPRQDPRQCSRPAGISSDLQPPPQPEIPHKLDSLHKLAAVLHEHLNLLEQRLDPALSPQRPIELGPDGPTLSRLGNMLQDLENQLSSACMRVESLQERIQI